MYINKMLIDLFVKFLIMYFVEQKYDNSITLCAKYTVRSNVSKVSYKNLKRTTHQSIA